MAMIKTGSASLVQANVDPNNWFDKIYNKVCSNGRCRIKTAKSIIAKYDPKKYLLSHCTIIAAVDTDLADSKDPKSDYLIKPEFSKFINNNGDAWTKKMLMACYKSFIGANNFLEHVQIPSLSKGKVIDAVPREVPIGKDKDGNDISTIYIDILVATDRKHKDLVRKIESNELNTLSMGCVIQYSICSKCGKKAADESEACQHIRFEKNNTYWDNNGVQRKIAELCGHYTEPDSVKFVDASWVDQPAFLGAVKRNSVEVPVDIMAKIEAAHEKEAYTKKENELLKIASHLIQSQEDEEEEPTEEAPIEEAPAEEEAPVPEVPEEAPPEEGMAEEPEEVDVDTIKQRIMKNILREIGDEITKQFTEEDRPNELATLDESIIKPANVLKKVWSSKKVWDWYLKSKTATLKKKDFDRLRYGTYIMLTNNDPTILADYGYNKRDFMACISFLDNNLGKPLPVNLKKAIAKIGGTNNKRPVDLLNILVNSIGRKLSMNEAKRSLIWLKLLDHYR